MRSLSHVAFVLLFLGATAAAPAAPTRIQSRLMNLQPNGLAVSPGGHQLAVINFNGLRLHAIDGDGHIGGTVATVNLRNLSHVAFNGSGSKIICTDNSNHIYLIRRDTWEVTTLERPRGNDAKGLAMSTPRREAYVIDSNGWLTVVDLPTAAVVDEYRPEMGTEWHGRDVCAFANGARLGIAMSRLGSGAPGVVLALINTPGDRHADLERILACTAPVACCVGPDEDYVTAIESDLSVLQMMNVYDGTRATVEFSDLTMPVDVAASAGFVWTVIADYAEQKLKAVIGDDLRAWLMPGPRPIVMDYDVPLSGRPQGVVTHPEKQIAYVWSWEDRRIDVVRLGRPPE